MIGWKPPAKKAYIRKTPQQRAAERSDERKKIKSYMGKADEWDVSNRHWCQYFLERRREYGEESIQIIWSLLAAKRLGIFVEEDVIEDTRA